MKPNLPPSVFLSASPESFRSRLLDWFDDHRRDLPWRRHRSLYGTWISEVMLQQTTVAVVEPYWKKFLVSFPDVAALAAAEEESVLAHWSGLGYYRRARQLHAAAQKVVSELGGQLPRDREGWLALPGIGPYASGAIASIGLGERVPAVDANARRVLSRWLLADPEAVGELKASHLELIGGSLVDETRPGNWNEAVMELGALVCRSKDPRCQVCPMAELCRARSAGTAKKIIPPKAAVKTTAVRLGLLVLRWGGSVLLLQPGSGPVAFPEEGGDPVRQDLSGLHRGLFGLPATPWLPAPARRGHEWPGSIWHSFLTMIPGWSHSNSADLPVMVGRFRHSITRYRLEVLVYILNLSETPPGMGEIPLLTPEIVNQGGGTGGTVIPTSAPLAALISVGPSPDLPISNLVRKSMFLAGESSI